VSSQNIGQRSEASITQSVYHLYGEIDTSSFAYLLANSLTSRIASQLLYSTGRIFCRRCAVGSGNCAACGAPGSRALADHAPPQRTSPTP
jgi:hypothetical protein